MSRFLGCGCNQPPQSELQPTVWAGRHNEWRRIPEMCDEFNSIVLNRRKWFPYSPFAFGTRPGLFLPSNVSNLNRSLRLSAKCGGVPDEAPKGYETWTTAAVVSQRAAMYGYFECCFRASNTALESTFQLIGKDDSRQYDIKVFSYSAALEHRNMVYMDATYSQINETGEQHTVNHPLKKAIFEMPENPVTVGIDWTPDYLKTYVDGQVIRHLENRHWHAPMHVGFTLATCPDEFEMPPEEPLGHRDAYEIYYLRSWHRYPSPRQVTSPGTDGE